MREGERGMGWISARVGIGDGEGSQAQCHWVVTLWGDIPRNVTPASLPARPF